MTAAAAQRSRLSRSNAETLVPYDHRVTRARYTGCTPALRAIDDTVISGDHAHRIRSICCSSHTGGRRELARGLALRRARRSMTSASLTSNSQAAPAARRIKRRYGLATSARDDTCHSLTRESPSVNILSEVAGNESWAMVAPPEPY